MFGRMVQNKFYTQYQYGRGDTVKRKSLSKYYLAEDKIFKLYDTFEIIKKMQKAPQQWNQILLRMQESYPSFRLPLL